MDQIFAELKYGLRSLLRDKLFTVTVLVTLAICMAANSTTLAIVSSVLLRPLPVPNSERILLMSNRYPGAGAGDSTNSDIGGYLDRRAGVSAFSEQALYRSNGMTLGIDGAPEQVDAMQVTPTFFKVIGVQPAYGRAFADAEGEIGAEQKVILTYPTWQRLFAGAMDAMGKDVRLNGRPYQVVGVMPRGFVFQNPDVAVIVPLTYTPEQRAAYHNNSYRHIGLLKAGATLQQAQAQVDAVRAAIMDKVPAIKEMLITAGFYTSVEPLQEVMVRDVRRTLFILWGGALFVLLIGALNVANLALVRFSMRAKEIATRQALGVSRAQLLRQFMTENVLLCFAGAVAGLMITMGLLQTLGLIGGNQLPRAHEIRLDALSVGSSFAIALLIGVLLGCLPLLGTLRSNLVAALHDSARSSTSGAAARGVRRSLVVAQVGFAFVLLLSAGLLLASFRALLHVDPGFTTEGVITAATIAPRARYAEDPQLITLVDRALEAMRALPGVKSAGITSCIPLGDDYSDSVIFAEGYQMKPGESVISPSQVTISPGYLETMGIQILKGRAFDERDRADSQPVILVDERLAKKFWGDRDPIGRRMYAPQSAAEAANPGPNTRWMTVIGVVRAVRLRELSDFGHTGGTYYYPFAQSADRRFTFAVRTQGGDPAALGTAMRAALAKIDPDLAMFDMRTMNERASLSLASRRTALTLAMGFGTLAVFLSAIGIYGVLACHVTQRRREFGIRMALGSTTGQIVGQVLREALLLASVGLAIGVGGSLGLQKIIAKELFGVRPLEPMVIVAALGSLAAVAFVAAWVPARRATRVDPMIVLRCE